MLTEDLDLQSVALVSFLRQINLIEMLLESTAIMHFDFKMNKQITLRNFIGNQRFKEVCKTAVRVIGKSDLV